ncbi:hypothetical protein ASJ33_05145 [Dehalococcoides mccartyi]|uniref:hypothetical protein n=1 Tax=Dehalococcoides mccartyi TaxID=61435 RepID=UPI00090C7008|nr:hypothetical protein [Dehalococcoides mccartyi]APH12580.1 hypothetical protein ASJ33_05145 [Dehalococcoides mccartyi]
MIKQENNWDFWKDLVCKPDGSLDIEAVKNELADYSWLMDAYSKLIYHFSGGAASKPDTDPQYVIDKAQEIMDKEMKICEQEAVEKHLDDISQLAAWSKKLPEAEGLYWCCYRPEYKVVLFIVKISGDTQNSMRLSFIGNRGDVPLSSFISPDPEGYYWKLIPSPALPEVKAAK